MVQNIQKNYLKVALSISLIIFGAFIVRSARGVPVTNWMLMYDPADFLTFQDLRKFILELRVPIPPVIAALEILTYQISGSTDLMTSTVYRIAIVGSFLLALKLASKSIFRMGVTYIVSLISMYGIVTAHKFNPQLYDVLYPFFFLLFFYLLSRTKEDFPQRKYLSLLTAFLSGLSLTLAELTRPFVWVILPFIIISVFSYLGRIRWREIAMVLLPVFLISGVWHANLWITHQQILWSNHGGFNLALAWPQVDTSRTELVPELNDEPVAVGRWPNINTEEHAINSQLLSAEVYRYIRDNPTDSIRFLGLRFLDFFVEAGPIHKSTRPVMIVFNASIHIALAYLSVNLTTLIFYLIASKMRLIKLLGNIDNMIIFTASSTLFITAIGSAVEESRLVLSVIPLLATLPYAKFLNKDNLLFSTRLIAIITVSIGVLTILFGIAGEHVSGFGYGENLSRFERNLLYFLGIFYILFGPGLYRYQQQELTETRLLS